MKSILLLFALLVFTAPAFAQKAMYDRLLEEKIRKLDLAHAQAILTSDSAGLDTLMDDEVTVNHPTNRIVEEKKELMEMIRQGVIRYTAFERFPEKLLFYKDMVIVMGNELIVPAAGATNAGKKLQRRYTNVWMKLNGKWKLAARHANNVL